MNIIVRPYGSGFCHCRPDTTWERESKDFYVPEDIGLVKWAPIVFVRICKAGKCIGSKFASRYYDAFNFGALMYCIPNTEATSNAAIPDASASCIDHTSLLPFPLYNMVVLETEGNTFKAELDGKEIFNLSMEEESSKATIALIEDTICKASQHISLRIGDLLAIELKEITTLAMRENSSPVFKASFCGNELFDRKIIF